MSCLMGSHLCFRCTEGGAGESLGCTFETNTAADYSNCWITTSLQEVGDSLVILKQSFINQAVSVQNCR